jgi:4a-hydroxytetrahydrobiopterin dehydratase
MASVAKKLSDAAIRQGLAKLEGWQHETHSITKEFVLDSFNAATRFIARIAPAANKMDHHPDVEIYKYKRVRITLTTHEANGITKDDLDLAAKIDALAA